MILSRTLGAALMAATLTTSAFAADLKPYQKAGLEKILATVDPDMRPMMRPQLESTMAVLNEQQVQAMVDAMIAGLEADEDSDDSDEAPDESYEASPEDLAFNEQQYEPAIRKLWQARRDCELYAVKTFKDLDPGVTYAIWGSAWRYEVRELGAQLETVYDNYDLYAMSFRGAAPTDGRYKFDFSNVDMTCKRADIEAAIKKAYADYTKLGQEFMEQVRTYKNSEESRKSEGDAAYDIQSNANQRVGKIQSVLEKTVGDAMPQGDQSLMTAMMVTAKRVR